MQEQTTEQQEQQTENVIPILSITEMNDLRTENDQLKTEIRLLNAREHILSALTGENARSPQLLFEACRDRLEFDDDGKLKSTADLISDLKQRCF